MPSDLYLAMNGAEIANFPPLSHKICFMACQFAPYGPGISNLPQALPEGSILMLNDQMQPVFHDAALVSRQLCSAVEALRCSHVLLDFQQPGVEATAKIAAALLDALPCPVIVAEPYAAELSCPVLLPPVPAHKALEEYLAPWAGRELWVEAAPETTVICVTDLGSQLLPCEPPDMPLPHFDADLQCHYRLDLKDDAAVFTLHRSWEDLQALMKSRRVTAWVGLYQELRGNI